VKTSVLSGLAVLLLAAAVRLPSLTAGYPYINYVDEGNFLYPVSEMLRLGRWEPGWYLYPSLPLMATATAARLGDPLRRTLRGGRSLADDLRSCWNGGPGSEAWQGVPRLEIRSESDKIWVMSTIRITSTSEPFDTPNIALKAVGIIARADAMGLLEDFEIHRLDLPSFRRVVGKIAQAGIGAEIQAAFSTPAGRIGAPEIERLLDRLSTVIEESPSPDHEWTALEEIFGADRLAALLGVSAPSVRRYRSGARITPDPLAGRLHFLATLVGDLAGAYNEIGIRRWFDRPRALLNGKSPVDFLHGEWNPEASGPRRLKELARSLAASPAT